MKLKLASWSYNYISSELNLDIGGTGQWSNCVCSCSTQHDERISLEFACERDNL